MAKEEGIDIDSIEDDADSNSQEASKENSAADLIAHASKSAWNILRLYFPEQKAQLLNFAAQLETIKKRVEIRFPGARDFVRPGFDQIA